MATAHIPTYYISATGHFGAPDIDVAIFHDTDNRAVSHALSIVKYLGDKYSTFTILSADNRFVAQLTLEKHEMAIKVKLPEVKG